MMFAADKTFDAVVIGGGFYGAAIAAYLARARGLKRVVVLERESRLMTRASYNNQARVHNGYHYPRSFTTAYRSRINLPRFVADWPEAINKDFIKLYAISRKNSKVTARQFERFCKDIGAGIEVAAPELSALFEPRLIEQVYQVDEYAFDSLKLASWAEKELDECGVQVRYGRRATAVYKNEAVGLRVIAGVDGTGQEELLCRYVFNCTYSGLNQIGGDFPIIKAGLKQEITEMALMQMPADLGGLGITVMDGPFFSVMPFPARNLHSLSHVRYTPHLNWSDSRGLDPYGRLSDYQRQSRVDRMVRDVARYIPSVANSVYQDSLFEVKTVLTKNEGDDGRPIFFERHLALPNCYSVLGGKIDNIYDILQLIEGIEIDHIAQK